MYHLTQSYLPPYHTAYACRPSSVRPVGALGVIYDVPLTNDNPILPDTVLHFNIPLDQITTDMMNAALPKAQAMLPTLVPGLVDAALAALAPKIPGLVDQAVEAVQPQIPSLVDTAVASLAKEQADIQNKATIAMIVILAAIAAGAYYARHGFEK